MKICIVFEGYIPSQEAASFSVMKMAQGFRKLDRQNEVTVLSLLSIPIIINFIKYSKIRCHYGLNEKIKLKLLPVWNLDFFSKSSRAKGLIDEFKKYIDKYKPDLIYVRDSLYCYESILDGYPTIVETHSTLTSIYTSEKLISLYTEPNYLALVTIHEKIKNKFIHKGFPSEKALVIEDGVDLERFNLDNDKSLWRQKLGLPLNKKIIMYSGNLYREKGIEDILLTAKNMQVDADLLFVLVGGKPEDIKKWKHYCSESKIDNVNFTGFVDNSDLPQYLKAADILIMLYNTEIQYKKMDINTTSPLKMYEYMASSRPIISTNIQTISKVLKHNYSCYLAKPNDIYDITKLIYKLINEKDEADRLSRNAYREVLNFDWSKRCEKILSESNLR